MLLDILLELVGRVLDNSHWPEACDVDCPMCKREREEDEARSKVDKLGRRG